MRCWGPPPPPLRCRGLFPPRRSLPEARRQVLAALALTVTCPACRSRIVLPTLASCRQGHSHSEDDVPLSRQSSVKDGGGFSARVVAGPSIPSGGKRLRVDGARVGRSGQVRARR